MNSISDRVAVMYPKTRMIILVLMALSGVVVGVIYGNENVMGHGCFGGLVLTICWAVFGSRLRSVGDATFSGTNFEKFCGYFSLLAWPWCVSVFVSTCNFSSHSNGYGYEKIWVIDNAETSIAKVLFALPFIQEIQSISDGQNVSIIAVATTKDSVQIQGRLSAELRLVSDESTILRAVKALVYPDYEIRQDLERLLESNFRAAIVKHDLADLQNNLVLELQTGKGITGEPLVALGLQWKGAIAITDLHVYFADEKQQSVL